MIYYAHTAEDSEGNRRARRRRASSASLPNDLLEVLDRLAFERTARPVRAVGFFVSGPSWRD